MTERGGARRGLACAALVLAVAAPRSAGAWVLHEHEAVVLDALAAMGGDERAVLGSAWTTASAGRAGVCAEAAVSSFASEAPSCASFATLTAVAADHSCSGPDLERALGRGWMADVLKVGAETYREIQDANAESDLDAVIDAWRDEHIRLQFADPKYLSRAGNNTGHFQAVRARADESMEEYLVRVLAPNTEPSAISLWVAYHFDALLLADGARRGCSGTAPLRCNADARALLWKAFLAESFALHFLSDAFSAGHAVGSWGDSPTRMGTHDYYSISGIEARQWSGRAYVAHGDAFLSKVDRERSQPALARSLRQLARAISPGLEPWELATARALGCGARSLDACAATTVCIGGGDSERLDPLVTSVVEHVPMPGLRDPALPRVANDVGGFLTSSIGLDFRQNVWPATYPWAQNPLGMSAAPIGMGFSVAGITSSATDSVLYLRVPIAVDGSVPGRDTMPRVGVGIDVHAPFYLLPLDSIPVGVALALGSLVGADDFANTCTRILNDAAAGSVYGHFGRRRISGSGYWQITAGREATLTFYLPADRSAGKGLDALASDGTSASDYWRLRAPLISWTPVQQYDDGIALRHRLLFGYDVSHTPSDWVHGVFIGWAEDSFLYVVRPK